MKATTTLLSGVVCLTAAVASAQTTDDVRIDVSAFTVTASGPEKRTGASLSSWRTTIGTTKSAVFSVFGCGEVAAHTAPPPRNVFATGAVAGWRVDITPTRIVDHVVTFRLRWDRALDTTTGQAPQREELTLTLKPGESRPVDVVPIPAAAKTRDGRPCGAKAATLRVSVDFPEWDNRLFGVDVWLVEKVAKGSEQSQLQTVRGVPHVQIPFYFDRIGDVDLFGHLVAEPARGAVEIAVEVVRAQANEPTSDGYQAAQYDRSTLELKPDEVVEMPLPRLEERFGPYSNRTFVLRIRARQLR